jgi:hypothetical protein
MAGEDGQDINNILVGDQLERVSQAVRGAMKSRGDTSCNTPRSAGSDRELVESPRRERIQPSNRTIAPEPGC